jgi:hypothetical protein
MRISMILKKVIILRHLSLARNFSPCQDAGYPLNIEYTKKIGMLLSLAGKKISHK